MMKKLELTVYPLLEKVGHMAERGYIVKKRAVPLWTLDYTTRDKRLTDTELAAEYWQADYADERYDREDEDLEPTPEILHRFATHDHYDQEDQ